MGAADRPEFLDEETPIPENREADARTTKHKRESKRGGRRRPPADREVPLQAARSRGDRRVSRERSLNRLLAGLRAVNGGDFSVQLTPNGDPLMAEIVEVFNSIVQKQAGLVNELARVSTSVGREGKMRDRAALPDALGEWASAVASANSLITDLVQLTSEVSRVIKAVAEGDLSQKVDLEIDGKQVQGEFFRIGSTVNRMVDQLNAFASEVTRVAREVGTEGVLGGQANVPGVAGTWKDLTDSVNAMASNLTNQVRSIAVVTTAVANGDLSQKIAVEARGEVLELKNTINTMVDQLNAFASEVTRVAKEVGTEGKLGGQARVEGISRTWRDLTENVNGMAANLTVQLRDVSAVSTAIANGDLTRKITVEAQGEILQVKEVINKMVDQLNAFAGEVIRVAREVGTEGILGGQASVQGVSGTWKDLTDNVNFMATNLTNQVRNIAVVTTAVANGDLSQKITVEAQGEVLSLKNTINNMVDRLRVFADEVTRVAKEVGTEGKLGGQAEVPNVSGTWKGLTDGVNAMANSLTMQVRNIADVATSVTKGDLTRQITVNAQGELDELKTNINQMIANLRETTERNREQDWLKTNLAKFSRMMQGQKDLESVSRLIMSELTPLVSAHHGAFFMMDQDAGGALLKLIASYAYRARKHVANRFAPGEGLVGQAALEKQPILLQNVPDDYIQITSGLGEAPPRNIIVLPILFEGEVKAVIELASFLPFSQIHQTFLDQLTESIGVVLNMIQANMRTEELLEQSQKLTQELQSQSRELRQQQEELKRSNTELEAQARTLRQSEELLREEQEEFQQVNEEEPPKYFAQMKRINKEGPRVLGGMPHPTRLSVDTLDGLLEQHAMIVDTRPAKAFAEGHIPGTINIPRNGSFTTWAGWLLPYDRDLYVIAGSADDSRVADAVARDLAMIGLDRVAGAFDTDVVAAWAAHGHELAKTERTTPADAAAMLERGEAVVVDVRGHSEWEAGHVPGVPNIPLGYLGDRVSELPIDRPVIVHCQSGSRSAIAASVLQARGFTNVIDMAGGFAAWQQSGLPVVRESSS